MSKLMEGAPCNITKLVTGQNISLGCEFINEAGELDGMYVEIPIEFEESGSCSSYEKALSEGLHIKLADFLKTIVDDNAAMTNENFEEVLKYMFMSHERGVELSTEGGKSLFRPINIIEGATTFSARNGENMTIYMTDNDIYGWYINHDVERLTEAREELGGRCDLDKFVSLVKPYSDFYMQKHNRDRDL